MHTVKLPANVGTPTSPMNVWYHGCNQVTEISKAFRTTDNACPDTLWFAELKIVKSRHDHDFQHTGGGLRLPGINKYHVRPSCASRAKLRQLAVRKTKPMMRCRIQSREQLARHQHRFHRSAFKACPPQGLLFGCRSLAKELFVHIACC